MIMRSQLRKDNRGIALISVMICATLCLLLSATILRVSLLSYRQKAISKQAASTFYENEAIVDDIKMGLQAKVATAFAVSSTTSRAGFVSNFKSSLLSDGGAVGSEKDKIEKALKSYLTGYDPTSTITDISVTVEGYDDGGTIKYFDESVAGEIVIKNVRIRYTDLERGGYVSEVKTDIRIRSPYVSESTGTSGGYSMFAGSGYEYLMGTTAKPAMQTIEGDIYIGYDPATEVKSGDTVVSATAMTWQHWVTIYWPADTSITINGDVRISGQSNLVILSNNVDIRGKIYVSDDSNVIIDKNAVVKCQDIVVECPTTVTHTTLWHDGWNEYPDCVEKPTADPDWPQWKKDNLNANGRWSQVTGDVSVVNWAGGKAVSSGYNSGSANVKSYLPTYGDGIGDNTLYNHSGNTSGLFAWDASVKKATRINKSSSLSSISGLTMDSSNRVHPRVSKTIDGKTYTFDEEYVKLIDVDYFFKFVKNSNDNFNPGGSLPTDKFDKTGTKYLAKSGVSSSDLVSECDDYRHQTYTYGNGKSHGIEVQCGNLQVINRSEWQFAIGGDCVTLPNDMNTGAELVGIIITPDRITATAREGSSTIKALADIADNTSYARTFFDNIGRQAMNKSSVSINYQLINNFFIGGIKVFYEDSQSSSGGSGQTVTAADKQKNATLDIITFENWEKNPAVS